MRDNILAKCSIAQMRRELHNFEFELEDIERLLDDAEYTAHCGTNAAGIKYSVEALIEVRKYFNRAFRYLLGELTDAE